MTTAIEKIKNINLGNGFELTNIEGDEGVIKGEFLVKSNELTYDSPYGIPILFEDELNKIQKLSEIDEVEISNVFTKHYEDSAYDYIVKFLAFTE